MSGVVAFSAMPGTVHPTSKELCEYYIINHILTAMTILQNNRVRALCLNLSRRGEIVVGRRGGRGSITCEVRCPIVHERASFLDRGATAIGSLGFVFDHVRQGCLDHIA